MHYCIKVPVLVCCAKDGTRYTCTNAKCEREVSHDEVEKERFGPLVCRVYPEARGASCGADDSI